MDAAFVPHGATLIHSLLDAQGPEVHIHVIAAPDVGARDGRRVVEWVRSLGAEITMHRPEPGRLARLAPAVSSTTWYRHLLPELVPELDRILYLDADTLVRDRIDPLWALDLSGHCVAAVTNPAFDLTWAARHAAGHGLPGPDEYFNSGVMLMNLGELRRRDLSARVFDYGTANADPGRPSPRTATGEEVFRYMVRHPGRLLLPDQDSANAILWEHRRKLHPRWNLQRLFLRSKVRSPDLTEELVAEAVADPAILHFEGPGRFKPWHPESDPQARALYWSHRNRTPWAEPAPAPV